SLLGWATMARDARGTRVGRDRIFGGPPGRRPVRHWHTATGLVLASRAATHRGSPPRVWRAPEAGIVAGDRTFFRHALCPGDTPGSGRGGQTRLALVAQSAGTSRRPASAGAGLRCRSNSLG